MAAQLTTLELVKAQLQLTYIDTYDAQIQLAVDATNEAIEAYCNRHFTDQDYTQTDFGTNDRIIQLRNHPVRTIKYSATGCTNGIVITYTGSSIASVTIPETENQKPINMLHLVDGVNANEITIDPTDTLDDLVTKINAKADWSATLSTVSGIGAYPARALFPGTWGPMESQTQLGLSLPTSPLVMAPEYRTPGDFNTSRKLDFTSQYTVIYAGGYKDDDYPADLVYGATQAAVNVLRASQRDQGLKSEKIGNYSWTAESAVALQDELRKHFQIFNKYRNFPGA